MGKIAEGGPLIEGWFDGVCEPRNPGGHAAWGALVKVNGQVVFSAGGYVGVGPKMSNNVAEYSGLIAVLEYIAPLPGPAIIRGDSKLAIYQNTPDPDYGKLWKVNGGLYMPYYLQARKLLDAQRDRLHLEWIPRDQNNECDQLSKAELHKRGVQFRIQPERPPAQAIP